MDLCLEEGEQEKQWHLEPLGWEGQVIRTYRCGKNLITYFEFFQPSNTWASGKFSSANTSEQTLMEYSGQFSSWDQFYTWVFAVTLTAYDPDLDPVATCYNYGDCTGTIDTVMAPEELNEYRYLFGSCLSFTVPYGTSLRVYDSANKSGISGTANYITI